MEIASNNNDPIELGRGTSLGKRLLPNDDILSLDIRGFLLGSRIEFGQINSQDIIGRSPLTVRLPSSIAVLFRFGVVVFFQFEKNTSIKVLFEELSIERLNQQSAERAIQESWSIRCTPGSGDGVANDEIIVEMFTLQRIQLAACALSKSLVIDEFETLILESFSDVEPLALELQQTGKGLKKPTNLLKHIGQVLKAKQQMANRANVIVKPELLWDQPAIESYFHKLEDHLEIRDRHEIPIRKLDLISSTAETALELLHTRHSLQLELYIVILIVVEIVLSVYDIFFGISPGLAHASLNSTRSIAIENLQPTANSRNKLDFETVLFLFLLPIFQRSF